MIAVTVRSVRNAYHNMDSSLVSYLDMLRAADIFQQGNPDAKVKEIKSWLASKGVRDFDPVPLGADQLKKVPSSRNCLRFELIFWI